MTVENPLESQAPAERKPVFRSLALDAIPSPDYADVIVIPCQDAATSDPRVWAETLFSVASIPPWVQALLALRQGLVRVIGVPPAGRDVFAVAQVSGEEALISTDDVHLDFRCGVAFDAGAGLLRVTTTVRFNGWRGRLYFAPVRLLHPVVVRSMMVRAARALSRSHR